MKKLFAVIFILCFLGGAGYMIKNIVPTNVKEASYVESASAVTEEEEQSASSVAMEMAEEEPAVNAAVDAGTPAIEALRCYESVEKEVQDLKIQWISDVSIPNYAWGGYTSFFASREDGRGVHLRGRGVAAGSAYWYLYTTNNYGKTWNESILFNGSCGISSIKSDGETIAFITYCNHTSTKTYCLMLSEDFGASWREYNLNDLTPLGTSNNHAVIISVSGNQATYGVQVAGGTDPYYVLVATVEERGETLSLKEIIYEDPYLEMGELDTVVFPQSSIMDLELYELEKLGLSQIEIRQAINEIYARHGYNFSETSWGQFYNHCSWYHNQYTCDVVLSDIEQRNVNTLAYLEKEYAD